MAEVKQPPDGVFLWDFDVYHIMSLYAITVSDFSFKLL